MEWIKKKLSENDDWLTWEILSYIENEFGVTYHPSYIIYALKKKHEEAINYYYKVFPQYQVEDVNYKLTLDLTMENENDRLYW